MTPGLVPGRPPDVAVDIGQSGIRGRILSADGQVSEFSSRFASSGTPGAVIGHLQSHLREAGVTRIGTLSVGATGLWGDASRLDPATLRDRLRASTALVADDCLTSLLGAIPDGPGIVIAIGTGIVGAVRSTGGRVQRVGGWGLWLDDRGSGAWIGRAAIRTAVATVSDPSGDAGELRRLCEATLGTLAELPERLAASSSPPSDLAALCGPLADLARDGNRLARDVFSEAGRHVGELVQAAASKAPDMDLPLALVGGVAHALDLMEDSLRSAFSGASVSLRRAEGSALDGACELIRQYQLLDADRLLRVASESSALHTEPGSPIS